MCKVCDMKAAREKLFEELGYRLDCYEAELLYDNAKLAEAAEVRSKGIFTAILDNIKQTRSLVVMYETMDETEGQMH